MGIDLEQPLGQEEILDGALCTNISDADEVDAGEEDMDLLRTCGDIEENPAANVNEDITKCRDGVDVSSGRVDVLNNGIIDFEPRKGLEFESKEAAYSFYRVYARSVGFGITIKASRRSKRSGKFIDVKIVCSRYGSKRESSTPINSRSCAKTDCRASMHMKRREDDIWFIYSFVKEHNHEISPDDFDYATRGRNKLSARCCQKKGLQLALDVGDVELLLDNFMLMQAENPSFFYALDLDQENCMRNLFWIDSKGRHDYSNFSDAVLFDTTYIKDKYNLPFTPIIGVNHHFQFMLLGCALVGDQTASTFIWLMNTWLRAVGGRAPSLIITDQDWSLKEAISEVFPDSRHCFCLWDVLRKIPESLSSIQNDFGEFMVKFNKCIYRSWTDEEFEKRWWKMVDKYNLREDTWFQSLYEDRKKWVPAYMRDICLAGLCTTERSNSISSYFDKYINKETTVKEFIDQYKVFLLDRYEEEEKADFETRHKQLTLRSLSPFEKRMSMVYTHAIFKKFQVEFLGIIACNLQKESDSEATVTFRVDDFQKRQNFVVTWNQAESGVYCLCRSFEYRGYLCRHAMIVLQQSRVSDIPPHYILKRWTKDAKTKQTVSNISSRRKYRVQRFNDLCKLAIKVGEEASLSRENYDNACFALEEALKHCVGVNNSSRSLLEPFTPDDLLSIEEENRGSNAAKASKRKKLQKKQKVQSEARVMPVTMQDSSQQMELLNPRVHPSEISYISQQEIQGMDLGSRTSNLDAYHGAQQQQGAQGLGQLNSLPFLRDGYYSNQQSMKALVWQLQ
ncbi:hypothetical protein RJ640_027590 [Escallonia rubra]|uniref:Protein FAR1-RELATED SEQUENCE n=1 Tax=Escallonia rubra TaxID=112253 RepID=A0AA88R7C7_9ASTE|nr:hypothetical protein RJ640_027590 [Escallonia rubra]